MKSYCRLITVRITDDNSDYNIPSKCWLDCAYISYIRLQCRDKSGEVWNYIALEFDLWVTNMCVVMSECPTMSLTVSHIVSPSSVLPMPGKTRVQGPHPTKWYGDCDDFRASEPWYHFHRDNISGRAVAENRFVKATSWIKDHTDL